MSYLDQIEAVRQGYLERMDAANAEKRAEYHKSCGEFLISLPGSSSLLSSLFRFDIAGVLEGNVKISDANGTPTEMSFTMEGLSGTPIVFKAFSWNCAIFRMPGLTVPLVEIEAWFQRWIGPGHMPARVPNSIFEMSAWFDQWNQEAAEHQGFIHGVSQTGDDEITVDFGTASLSAFDELLLILESAGAPELEIDAGSNSPLFDEAVRLLQKAATPAKDFGSEEETEVHPEPATEPLRAEPEPLVEDSPAPALPVAPEVEGAAEFFAWFNENGVRLAALADRAASEEASGGASPFAEIETEVLEMLAKVDDGLGCQVCPGEHRRFALILSPQRQPALVQKSMALMKQAPDMIDWEFQPFRPARPLDQPLDVVLPAEGAIGEAPTKVSIDPGTVQVALEPKVCRLDVVLYISDLEPELEGRIGMAGPQILESVLGERSYVEGVASVAVKAHPDDTAEAMPLNQVAGQFAKHAASLRMSIRKLDDLPTESAVATCLEPLMGDLAALEQTLADYGPYEAIRVSLSFWSESRDQRVQVESILPEFEIWVTPALSLIGEGFEIEAEGVCPVTGASMRKWLADRVTALYEQGLILIRLGEQEIAPMGMEQLIDSRATALMSEGQWAEAATMLRPLIERIGEAEAGRIHAKAGLCYLRAGHAQPAIPLFEQALELTRDTDLMGQAHNYLGIALQEAGQIEDAFLQFQKAVALGPKIGARHYNLGQYYALLGDPDQAAKHLTQAIEHDPDLLDLLLEDEDLEAFRKTSWFKKLKKIGLKNQKKSRGKKPTKAMGRPARQARPEGQSGSAFGRIFGRFKKSA